MVSRSVRGFSPDEDDFELELCLTEAKESPGSLWDSLWGYEGDVKRPLRAATWEKGRDDTRPTAVRDKELFQARSPDDNANEVRIMDTKQACCAREKLSTLDVEVERESKKKRESRESAEAEKLRRRMVDPEGLSRGEPSWGQ